jgi:hypothetical protein
MLHRLFPRLKCFVQIDWAMLKLPAISITVRQLKNSLVPVNRLPPEILTLIPTFRESEQDLISATAVCKCWRRTLTSTPVLWTNITCSEQASQDAVGPRVHAYFERSESVPVDVQIHAHASQLLSPYTERISRLTMFLDNRSDLDEIAGNLSKPAPLLETITFRARNLDHRGLVLPPRLFEAFLSSVKTLTLRGAILSPGQCKFSKLTRFILKTFVTRDASAILLDALEQMPLLQIFESKLLRVHRRDPLPSDRVVTLPHLEEIAIAVDEAWFDPAASPILPALCLPRVRRVTMRSINPGGLYTTPILPRSFEERLPGLNVTPEVNVTLDKGSTFHGLYQSKLILSLKPTANCAFTQSMFGGTPFDSVRKLRVSFRNSAMDAVFFVGLLRSLRGLECLEMKRNTVGPLDCWIGEGGQAEICPALVTLTITDADLTMAGRCAEELKRVRERAEVPIASVEIRND